MGGTQGRRTVKASGIKRETTGASRGEEGRKRRRQTGGKGERTGETKGVFKKHKGDAQRNG